MISKHRQLGRMLLFSLALFAGLFGVWRWHVAGGEHRAAAPSSAPAAVPVDVATAQRADFPVYLNGIGVAQAWNMVTIRTRVDGQIEKVAFKEGGIVKQGDLMLQLDPRPLQAALDQAEAKLVIDQALLENGKRDLERYTTVGTLAVTQQQIDTQRALVKQQEAQIKSDRGAIDSARVQLGYATITAPIGGRVGFRMVDEGNIVHASDAAGIASIAQLEPIAVVFTVPEEQLVRVNDALKAGALPVVAYNTDGKTQLDVGTLAVIDNQIDATTGTVRLKAEFPNRDHKLWPALTVATRLQVETLHDVVVVPDTAVQRGPAGLFAYVVDKDGKADTRKLTVGPIVDGRAVVTEGLDAGARVVTGGYDRLQPGSRVEIRHEDGAAVAPKPIGPALGADAK